MTCWATPEGTKFFGLFLQQRELTDLTHNKVNKNLFNYRTSSKQKFSFSIVKKKNLNPTLTTANAYDHNLPTNRKRLKAFFFPSFFPVS